MMRRSPVPPSPAFEAAARGAQFRDRIAVVVKAPPEAIFQALHEVTLRDMKFAWLLGELRYLPSRLAGRMPAADSRRPFMKAVMEGGTLVLRDDAPREVITGSAAQLHRVHQAPQRFASREAFEAFDDPGPREAVHERACGADRPDRVSTGWSWSTRPVRCRHSRNASSRGTGARSNRWGRLSPGSCCGQFAGAPNVPPLARSRLGGSGGQSTRRQTNAHAPCPETSGFRRPSTR